MRPDLQKTRDLALNRTVTRWSLPNCERCGHSPDDHRLDDSLGVPPTSPDAKYRCVGHQDENGRWVDTACDCPDYVGKDRQVQHAAPEADA